jgi:hypothetical protein
VESIGCALEKKETASVNAKRKNLMEIILCPNLQPETTQQ